MDYVLHPKSEIDSRIKKLKDRMDDIDGALLFQAVDMCYFSGTAQDGLVYIPRDGEPIIMMKRSLVRAKEESPLEVRPLKNMRNLKEDLGIKTSATIGLEMDVLPCSFYFRVNKALEDASFVDVAERIKHIRSVKSEFEIKLAKEAAQMLVEGFSTVPDHIKEGMTEVELMCRMESEMRLMGHQGSLRFRRFNSIVPIGHIMSGSSAAIPSFLASPTGGRGTSVVFPHGPGYRKIKRNEPVFVDTVGICNGYIADATRIFCLGKIEPELVEAYEASCQIEEAIAREMMPGRTARELFELSESEGARLGYGDFLGGTVGSKCGFVGHGVGLELDEYPVLAPLDHEIQEALLDGSVAGYKDPYIWIRAELLDRLQIGFGDSLRLVRIEVSLAGCYGIKEPGIRGMTGVCPQ